MLLPFIVAGITTGSVYGLAGVGLVLTYKTSNVFNFAEGALGTISAFLFYTLFVQHGMPWPVAALISVLVIGVALGCALEYVARAVASARLDVRVVSTVGVLLIVQAVVVLIYGTTTIRTVPQFLPQHLFQIFGTAVPASSIIETLIALVATCALYLYFRYVRTGVAMRAVVDNPELLGLAGTSPRRVRRWAWIIGVVFATACGVLLAPLVTLDSTTLTLLVVQAFGAAAIGGFRSLPLTYIGGLIIGIGSSVATKYVTSGLLSGLPSALPFILLFVVLLVSRKRLSDRVAIRGGARSRWVTPLPIQLAGGVAVLAVLVSAPYWVGFHLTDWTLLLTYTIMFLSLGLLVRTSGQVSLCQIGFAAIGVCAFSHFVVGGHLPWALALLCSGLIAVPIGTVLAIPAIRLSGLYLALATFGFGVVLAYMFYIQPFMFGPDNAGLPVPMPAVAGLDTATGFYYLVLAITVLVTVMVIWISRSRLGRLLQALSDSPRGLAADGVSTNVTLVLVFCISAFLAAVAGALGGAAESVVTGDSYQPLLSLTYFAVVIIVAGGAPWYALGAGAGLALIPSYFPSANVATYLELAFGIGALVYALTPEEARGAPPGVRRLLDRIGGRDTRRPADGTPPAEGRLAAGGEQAIPSATDAHRERVAQGTLEVSDIGARFGGVIAVDSVTLTVPTQKIVGLIGPNGAGKTTTFNACSGLTRPSHGTVTLNGRNLLRFGPAGRARRGLGRTFQQMELFDSLTVEQNVALGMEGSYAGLNPARHLFGSRTHHARVTAATKYAIDSCGLTGLADRLTGTLSTGQRRLVELARCLAGPFQILLLDEPSSGLDRTETTQFGQLLRQVVRERGVGILLVEHDMTLVSEICDYIYVMDFGRQIYEGTPVQVINSPVVRAAYLGGDEAEEILEAEGMLDTEDVLDGEGGISR